jgi:hypothetical protein
MRGRWLLVVVIVAVSAPLLAIEERIDPGQEVIGAVALICRHRRSAIVYALSFPIVKVQVKAKIERDRLRRVMPVCAFPYFLGRALGDGWRARERSFRTGSWVASLVDDDTTIRLYGYLARLTESVTVVPLTSKQESEGGMLLAPEQWCSLPMTCATKQPSMRDVEPQMVTP